MGSGTLSLQTDTVRFLGPDTAVFTGTSTMRGSQPAGGVDQGHYMVIAKRIKGQWKASEVHLAAIPAATEPAAVGTAGGSGAAAEAAVNEVEDLTTGLARKVWQKLMILYSMREEGASRVDA